MKNKGSCLVQQENFCLFLMICVWLVVLAKSEAFLCSPYWIINHFYKRQSSVIEEVGLGTVLD